MCEQTIKLLRNVTHQCIVLKDHAGEKVYIDLAPIADKLESQARELAEMQNALNLSNTRVNVWKEEKIKETQRAEQAEAQCAYLIEAYCGECDYDHEICRGTQPDMQCAVRTLDDSASAKLLAELQRYREAALSASSSAPAGEDAP